MIEVRSLTKRYATVTAVDGISFDIDRNEVVGFLGPNGAGKTTTMKILSCFMPATSGTAKVAGFDVVKQSLEVRRRIGYLPENVPLPFEMRAEEYLNFRARLKGLSRVDRKTRVQRVMEQCGVAQVKRKIIGALSKGFRQRVGLADALLADPPILILDEPTVGLDPEQILQVRSLIQELGQNRTILLSTHILPEVEKVCQRVLIISRGKIRAIDSVLQLQGGGGVGLEVLESTASGVEDALRAVEGVSGVDRKRGESESGWVRFFLHADGSAAVRERVFRLAADRGWVLRELSDETRRLEDVYIDVVTRGESREERAIPLS